MLGSKITQNGKAKNLAAPSGNRAQTSLFGPFAEIENYATHKGPTHILAQYIANTYKAAYKTVLAFPLTLQSRGASADQSCNAVIFHVI